MNIKMLKEPGKFKKKKKKNDDWGHKLLYIVLIEF